MGQTVLSLQVALTLIVLPVAYRWFSDSKKARPGFPQQRRICDDQEPVQQA